VGNQLKTSRGASTGQQRRLASEHELASSIDFEEVISDFALKRL
jgi:hypothetical protein